VYIFHEGFNVGLRDVKVDQFVSGLLMYSASYTSCDNDKGVRFSSFVLYVAN
jgi:hypothetical protein